VGDSNGIWPVKNLYHSSPKMESANAQKKKTAVKTEVLVLCGIQMTKRHTRDVHDPNDPLSNDVDLAFPEA